MRDLQFPIVALDQRASGTIEITDYEELAGKAFTVGATILTEGVDFDAETDNATTASNLHTVIDAISGVNSSVVDEIISIHADAPGVAGNSLALSTDAVAGVTLSGETLLGGVAATYSDVLELEEGLSDVEASINITGFTGASGDLTISLEYSYNKVVWFDDTESVFAAITGATSLPAQETKAMTFSGIYVRVKVETTGVISSVTGQVFVRAVEGGEGDSGMGNATAAKQDTGNSTLASILSKIIAAPSTEAKQDAIIASLATLLTQTDGIEASLTSIDGGTPAALGQTTMANSSPVVIASNQSALPTSANAATLPAATTMQNAAVANGNGTSLNVQGYSIAVLNIVSSVAMSGGTTINFEASVDDTTWVSIAAHQVGAIGTQATSTTTDGDYRIPVAGYKSVRARISGYSAGTVTVKGYVTPIPGQATAIGISGGNIPHGSADSGNPVKTGGKYNSSAPTLSDGQRGDTQLDSKGNTQVNLNTLISGENQGKNRIMTTRPGTWIRMTIATTTTHVSGTCILSAIIVEVTLTGTVTVYDGLSASGNNPIILPVGTVPGVYGCPDGAALTTGLTVVTSAADRIVVGYALN